MPSTYTVKQLAQLSGVSVRTLHWYDEIGLLKPAFYGGSGGYRYYEEEQLLLLQQILFFRELGFRLDAIQNLLEQEDFDKIKALQAHRAVLDRQIDSTRILVHTIDQTINHLKGKTKMKDQEFYNGFDKAKQKEYEKWLVKYHGTVAEDLIAQSKKRTVEWGSKDWNAFKEEGNAIYAAVAECIKKDLSPRDADVQKLVDQHFKMVCRLYDPSKDVYMGLAQLYCEHPDFRKFFDPFHLKLAEFLAEAMRVYAMDRL